MTAFVFDARSVEPDSGRVGAVPKGWYPSIISSTEIKPTGDGSGAYISASGKIVDGPHKGAMWFTNFNIQNNSDKAVEIGYKQLSALCHAVGVLNMTDTDQLKNIPFFVRLKFVAAEMDPQDPTKVKYDEKNEPTAYRNINDQAAIESMKGQGTAPAQAAMKAPTAPPAPAQPQNWVNQPPAAPSPPPTWGQPPSAPVAPPAPVQPPPTGAPAWGQQPPAQPWGQQPPALDPGQPQTAPAAPPPWKQG